MKVIAVGLLALAAAAGLMSLTATAQDLQSQPVDVSYSPGETRMLTDDEFAQLKQGLHFTPDSVPMSVGATARTALVDGVGKTLAIIQVQWLGGPSSTDPSAYFHITFQNLSGCLFSPSASFGFPSSPTGGAAISLVTWNGWSAIHSASAGETESFDGSATLASVSSLVFQPSDPDSAVSQCRTNGAQQQPGVNAPYSGDTFTFTDAPTGLTETRTTSVSGDQINADIKVSNGSEMNLTFSRGEVHATRPDQQSEPPYWTVQVTCTVTQHYGDGGQGPAHCMSDGGDGNFYVDLVFGSQTLAQSFADFINQK